MSETALKFGPEWLRALSHGGSLSSPPSSPGPVKFKLADYRYGRQEMLALFSRDYPPLDGLQNLGSLCIEQMQEPLAFLPMNLEEQNGSLPNDSSITSNIFSSDYLKRMDSSISPLQRIWQRCVNSEAVLRGSGRASINGVGRGRGGSVDRGRGRGRGVGAPYYSRGLSYDEEPEIRGSREGGPPGMPLRNKSYERSQSMGDSRGWAGERTPMERAPGAGEERSGAASPQKGRAATDNWRSRASEEEGGDRWRGLVHSRNEKWGSRGGWREREGGNEADWEDGRGQGPSGTTRSSRPPWDTDRGKEGQRRQWEDDNLPEWATEAAEDKGGSFDATGAFHAPGSSDEDDVEREEFSPPKEPHEKERVLKPEKAALEKDEKSDSKERDWSEDKNPKESFMKMKRGAEGKSLPGAPPHTNNLHLVEGNDCDGEVGPSHSPLVNGILSEEETSALCSPSPPVVPPKENPTTFPPAPTAATTIPPPMEELEERREEDKLEHMQSVADDLVAKLVEEDDLRPLGDTRARLHHPPPGGFIPSESVPPPEEQWYYTDPQGDIQGPFSSADMAAWYKAGYFKPTLLLRRQCDDKFAQLGDLTSLFGRIPFLSGPAVPPLKVSDLLNAQKAQAERERYEMMQAQIIQKQLYQQQNSLRQQQVLQTLQSLEDWGRLSAAQQHQLFLQHLMALPPLVPPTLPVSLHTVTPTTTHSAHSQQLGPDLRVSLSTSGGPPPLPPQPDPIQAFVAQMATSSSSSASVPVTSETPVTQPPPSTSPIGGESPLQKLLLQLQRSSQGAGLTTSAPIVAGHPSSMGGPPPSAALGLEKGPPDQQYDAIQSLMSQLTKMQIQPPDSLKEEQRQREEEQKRIEDERRQFEEQKRAEEERIKIQELRLQEERLKEEERRKELEAKNQRLEEELRRIQEEQLRRRREEENRIKEAEKKKLEHQQKVAEANKRDEEHKRQQQQLKKQRQEEEARKREEARKAEEARKTAEEEEKRKEEQRIKAEEKRKEEEERKRKEEKERQQQIQVQEEMRRIALEEERRRMQQLEEEERRKQHQEEQTRRQQQHQEEQARRQQQQLQQQEEQTRRQQQQQQPQQQEEQTRRQQQPQQQEEQTRRQQQQQQHLEEQTRRQQQQKCVVQEKVKQVPPAWNNVQISQDKNSAPSLVEIQKAQEIKERKEREAEAQRESQRQKEVQRQAAEEKKQKEANIKWAARVQSGKGGSKNVVGQQPQPPIKSLLEIQKEEEKELKKRQEKEQAERAAAISHLSLNAAGVWGSAAQSLSWANRASSGTTPSIPICNSQGPQHAWGSSSNTIAWSAIAQSNPSGWNSDSSSAWNLGSNQNSGGFWESPEAVKGSCKASAAATNSIRSPPKGHANQSQSSSKNAGVQAVNSNNKNNKKNKKDESENVKKLFADSVSPADSFTQWCKASLHSMKVHASIDIPTFVGFLADVESPYEVHDYIRSYLGDSKEVKEFAKQYLERRSKARNAQKEKHEDDNILAPAPAVNPGSGLEFQEVKTRLKRGRKKLQKVDSGILGFNVSSLERVDVEDCN